MVRRNGLLLLCAALLGGVCAPARGATVSLQPAAGAVGTLATVRGAGLPARRGVAVRVGAEAVQTLTDERGAFSVRVRMRARAVRTAVGRARIVNHFAIGGRRSSAEVATPAGAWLRWSPLVAKGGAPI